MSKCNWYSRANGIRIITFPPHCSHKLQPLDISAYKKALNERNVTNPGKRVTIDDLPEIFKKAYHSYFTVGISELDSRWLISVQWIPWFFQILPLLQLMFLYRRCKETKTWEKNRRKKSEYIKYYWTVRELSSNNTYLLPGNKVALYSPRQTRDILLPDR